MAHRSTQIKIAPVVKCSPSIYTFTTAIFTTTTCILMVALTHTPHTSLKALFFISFTSLIFSIFRWAEITISESPVVKK